MKLDLLVSSWLETISKLTPSVFFDFREFKFEYVSNQWNFNVVIRTKTKNKDVAIKFYYTKSRRDKTDVEIRSLSLLKESGYKHVPGIMAHGNFFCKHKNSDVGYIVFDFLEGKSLSHLDICARMERGGNILANFHSHSRGLVGDSENYDKYDYVFDRFGNFNHNIKPRSLEQEFLYCWWHNNSHRVAANDICLIHGDARPDNIIISSRDWFLIDFEFSRVAQRLLDIASFRVHRNKFSGSLALVSRENFRIFLKSYYENWRVLGAKGYAFPEEEVITMITAILYDFIGQEVRENNVELAESCCHVVQNLVREI